MAVLKILDVLFAFMFLYILFLVVCSLFVDSKKEYEKHSKFYRVLLNGATSIAIKIMRIRLHVSGIEKIPPDTKNLLFVSNTDCNFTVYDCRLCLQQPCHACGSVKSRYCNTLHHFRCDCGITACGSGNYRTWKSIR